MVREASIIIMMVIMMIMMRKPFLLTVSCRPCNRVASSAPSLAPWEGCPGEHPFIFRRGDDCHEAKPDVF